MKSDNELILDNLNNKKSSLQNSIKTNNDKIKEYQKNIDSLQTEINQIEAQLKQLDPSDLFNIRRLEQQKAYAQESQRIYKEQLRNAQDEVNKNKSELSKVEDAIKKYQNVVTKPTASSSSKTTFKQGDVQKADTSQQSQQEIQDTGEYFVDENGNSYDSLKDYERAKQANATYADNTRQYEGQPERDFDGHGFFDVPIWSVKDFFNDRVNWQKQLTTLGGDPGFFYFKIFFKFDTNDGLFGGVAKNAPGKQNCALHYLELLQQSNLYKTSLIEDRIVALKKFVSLLSFISCNAPWFFMSIKGLDEASNHNLQELTKEHTISIECMPDAIDMRLTTLFDLYKFVCQDYMNSREILTDNLKKFDMSVMIMTTPIRFYQTAFQYSGNRARNNGKSNFWKYKQSWLDKDYSEDVFSFKLFDFKNCEFVIDDFKTLYGDASNEKYFQTANASIKIKYDRCFQHTSNEFSRMFFGDGGFYWDGYKAGAGNFPRINDINNAQDGVMYSNTGTNQYKAMVETNEFILNDAMTAVNQTMALGNLYGQPSVFEDMSMEQPNSVRKIASDVSNVLNAPQRIWDNAKSNANRLKNYFTSTKDRIANEVFVGYNSKYNTGSGKTFEDYQKEYNVQLTQSRSRNQPMTKNEALHEIFQEFLKNKDLGRLY